jgi:dTDP-glucose pyrophosphorylase
MINIVIPMAGEGSRFIAAGYEKPKPFIDVNGKPMIEHVIENLKCENARYILIGREEHLQRESEIIKKIKNKYNAIFIGIDKLTEGTACTVLYARKYINNQQPLLIANSDQLVDINIQNFVNDSFTRSLDGSILTFVDVEQNPKWSFAKIGVDDLIVEVVEKKAISKYATVGIYLFNRGNIFVDAAIDMIVSNDRVNNEFYTCPVYNYSINNNNKFGIYNIKSEEMHGLGTPEDLNIYLNIINK